jgi:hypothetical protein
MVTRVQTWRIETMRLIQTAMLLSYASLALYALIQAPALGPLKHAVAELIKVALGF